MIIKALCPHVDCCPGVWHHVQLINPRDLAVTIATVAMVIGCDGAWHHVQLINPRDLAVTIVTVAMTIEKDDLQLVAPTLSCFRDD